MDYRDDGDGNGNGIGKEYSDEKPNGIPTQETSSVSSQGATFASDSLTTYLNEIRKPELLSAEEECHCARQALLGDEAGRRRLIESNLRLVVNIAKRYVNRGMALADLVEEGNLGLIHSVGKFDPELGCRFSTYSTWWIRQTIERGLMNQARTVRLPVHVVKEMRAMMRIDRENFTEAGLPITNADLAQITQKTRADIERLKLLNEPTLSADAPLAEGSADFFVDSLRGSRDREPDRMLQLDARKEALVRWLQCLTPRQYEIIVRRFGLEGREEDTLDKIGEDVGVTRERVRQIQIESLRLLREIILAEGLLAEHLD